MVLGTFSRQMKKKGGGFHMGQILRDKRKYLRLVSSEVRHWVVEATENAREHICSLWIGYEIQGDFQLKIGAVIDEL